LAASLPIVSRKAALTGLGTLGLFAAGVRTNAQAAPGIVGAYSIRGNRVFHKVETAVFTNLVGTTLVRDFDLAGDTLTLRTVPPGSGGTKACSFGAALAPKTAPRTDRCSDYSSARFPSGCAYG